MNLPELVSVYPHYGSTELYGTDAQLQFDFGGDNVFPAKRGATKGKLGVYRGGIKSDGTIAVIHSSVLYEITTLDEAHTPDPLSQGNILCTTTGTCNVTLSTATSTGMSPGEVYFLAFYPDSWSNDVGNSYYLFANNTNSSNAIYYHLFYSRSFNIPDALTRTMFGKNLVIEGVNLLTITDILAKENSGAIANGTWTTTHIKINLSFASSTCSSSLLPFASIYMHNVNNTHITIENMDLKDCNNGNLMADFEIVRGIKSGIDTYTHIRREFQKGVNLGTIACDPSCLTCSGPTASECIICTNYATEYMLNGTCISACPATHPNWIRDYIVFSSTEYETKNCLPSCSIGYFVNNITYECEACNLDCQTCDNNQMFGCKTCNPIKYYYYGMCSEVCPTPEYLPQNKDYQCVKQNVTSYINVDILKDAYLYKLPRNKQVYLKAYVNNTRGAISSVKWTQISPAYSRVSDNVFTMEYSNITHLVYNDELTLKLRMTSFTYISEVTSIKYMLEVTNSMGDVAKELTEFYINPAPVVDTMTYSILSGQATPEEGNTTIQ